MGDFLQRMLGRASKTEAKKPQEAPALEARSLSVGQSYQGARVGRRENGWIAGNEDANSSIIMDLANLRKRSRELTRNNPWASKYVQTMAANIVGPSLSPSANTGDKALDKIADGIWKRYQSKLSSDGLPFPATALIFQAVHSWVESGEVLCRKSIDSSQSFPLSISLLESDFLDHSLSRQLPDGGSILAGIESNQFNRIVAYHIHRSHPGAYLLGQNYELQRIPSDQIAHLYKPSRPGQRRGVPWLSPAMLRLRDIDRYADYELTRKKLEASLGVFVTGTTPPSSMTSNGDFISGFASDLDGYPVETLSPGAINYLNQDQDVKILSPSPQGGYSEYIVQLLHDCSAGLSIPYALLSGDLRQVNYSSIRAGLLDFYRSIQILQRHFLIPLLADRIWSWMMEAAYLKGEIETPEIAVEWTTSKMPSVDPLKEAKAALLDLRIGARTLREIISERGRDYDTVIAEMSAIQEETEALGLHFEWMNQSNEANTPENKGDEEEEDDANEE